MSYILDALKRSDQDRRQGEVPGIQSQPDSRVLASSAPLEASRKSFLIWFLPLLAGALLVWAFFRSPTPESGELLKPDTVVTTERHPPVDVTPPVAARTPLQEQHLGDDHYLDELKDVQLDVSPVEDTDGGVSQSPTVQAPDIPIALTVEREVEAQTPAESAPSVSESNESTSSTGAPDPDPDPYEGIPHQRQLAYDLQDALPDLNISVHVYSAAPSSRLVRINNTVYREGDRVDSELKLEKITQDGLIMSIRDNRFWRYVR